MARFLGIISFLKILSGRISIGDVEMSDETPVTKRMREIAENEAGQGGNFVPPSAAALEDQGNVTIPSVDEKLEVPDPTGTSLFPATADATAVFEKCDWEDARRSKEEEVLQKKGTQKC